MTQEERKKSARIRQLEERVATWEEAVRVEQAGINDWTATLRSSLSAAPKSPRARELRKRLDAAYPRLDTAQRRLYAAREALDKQRVKESGALFVATMDTGGISYSGDEYYALGRTEEEAKEAVAEMFRERMKNENAVGNREIDGSVESLNDYYGLHARPITVGGCVIE